jgi:DNA-binding transcriptional MocR family regulator
LGGLALWLQLKKHVDNLALFRNALGDIIGVVSDIIFSGGDAFKNCMRLSCGMPYDDAMEDGIETLAAIVRKMS